MKRNWYEIIQSQSKNPICRTYSVFKFVFRMEPYLKHVSDYRLRRSLTQIRTSSHALGIETSRHKRKYDRIKSSRLCSECNVLEDEAHFVLHYPRFALERKHLFDQYFIINQVFDILNVNEKIMYIFNPYDKHHLIELGKFVYTAFTIHNNSIDK